MPPRSGGTSICLFLALALFQSLMAASTASRASGMSEGEAIMTRSTEAVKLMPQRVLVDTDIPRWEGAPGY